MTEIPSRPVVVNGLYRGKLAYDEPLRATRCDAGTGKRHDPEYNRLRHKAYRENNLDAHRLYMREYKRKWRKRKREEATYEPS